MQVIYIGPSIRRLGVQYMKVFEGGLPPYMNEAVKVIPEIERLIVPVNELSRALDDVSRKGSLLNRAYETVAAVR